MLNATGKHDRKPKDEDRVSRKKMKKHLNGGGEKCADTNSEELPKIIIKKKKVKEPIVHRIRYEESMDVDLDGEYLLLFT